MTSRDFAAAQRVSTQFETLWAFDYEPTSADLQALYEAAKRAQWNASLAIGWNAAAPGSILDLPRTFGRAVERLPASMASALDVELASWRLSQFLHGEQGALLVASQLVDVLPELDAKLYASTQVADEGRHVEVFARYLRGVGRVCPVDPSLKAVMDDILAAPDWPTKLLGMQMIVEGLAIAGFRLMRRQAADPTLRQILERVLQDEGRHVNFGFLALRRAIGEMADADRHALEDFALRTCARLHPAEGARAFPSLQEVWMRLGVPIDEAQAAELGASPALDLFHGVLFREILLPRLGRLGLMSPRVEPGYRKIGLLA